MKSPELPAALPRAGTPAGFGSAVYRHTVRRLVDRFTYPAEKPSITLMLYYVVLLVVGILVVRYIPGAADMISGKRLAAAFVLSALFNFIMLAMEGMNYGSCALGTNPRALLVGTTPGEKKTNDFNAVLGAEVRRFHLAEIEASSKGKGVLKYLIRMGKRLEPETLEDALIVRCAPDVLGARIH